MLGRLSVAVMLLAGSAAAAQTVQPGLWRTTVTVASLAMPGMPAAQAKASVGKATTVSACVTAADVADGSRKLFEANPAQCRTNGLTLAGGRITSKATCKVPGGGMTVATSGTYTATSYATTSTVSATNGLKMVSNAKGTRVGACKK